jgi:hypothetical protein
MNHAPRRGTIFGCTRPRPAHTKSMWGATVVRNDLNVLPHVPADLAPAMDLVNLLLIATGLELDSVIGQDIGGNDRRVVFQQAERAAQPHAVHY